MGWNFDTKDITLDRLEKTFNELKLDRYQPNILPLRGGGEMRFREKLRTGRMAMKHDWNSGAKLGDRSEPTVLEIADRDGRLVRGWSDEGEVLECDGMRFSSPEQLFLIRRELGRYLLSGGDITITGCGRVKSVSFIDPVSGQTFDDQPAWHFDRGKLAIHCDGRQRLLWCMTDIPGNDH